MKLSLIALFLFAVACGGEEKKKAAPEEEHDHTSKHGGDLLTLGDHEGHLEVKINHEEGSITVWATTVARKNLSLDAAPVLTFTSLGDPIQVVGKGANHTWVFTDDALKGEPANAKFRLKIGGRTFNAKWGHEHTEDLGHDHNHDHGDGDEGHAADHDKGKGHDKDTDGDKKTDG